jgi:hypothetical protein
VHRIRQIVESDEGRDHGHGCQEKEDGRRGQLPDVAGSSPGEDDVEAQNVKSDIAPFTRIIKLIIQTEGCCDAPYRIKMGALP